MNELEVNNQELTKMLDHQNTRAVDVYKRKLNNIMQGKRVNDTTEKAGSGSYEVMVNPIQNQNDTRNLSRSFSPMRTDLQAHRDSWGHNEENRMSQSRLPLYNPP